MVLEKKDVDKVNLDDSKKEEALQSKSGCLP